MSLNKNKDSIFRERIESEEGLNQSPSATIKTRLLQSNLDHNLQFKTSTNTHHFRNFRPISGIVQRIGITISSHFKCLVEKRISIPSAICKSRPMIISYLDCCAVSSTATFQLISRLGANSGNENCRGMSYLVTNFPAFVVQETSLSCFRDSKNSSGRLFRLMIVLVQPVSMSTLLSRIDLRSLSLLIITATDISSINPVVERVLVSYLTLV